MPSAEVPIRGVFPGGVIGKRHLTFPKFVFCGSVLKTSGVFFLPLKKSHRICLLFVFATCFLVHKFLGPVPRRYAFADLSFKSFSTAQSDIGQVALRFGAFQIAILAQIFSGQKPGDPSIFQHL